MTSLSQTEAEKVVASVTIPPRPTIVMSLMEERAKAEPDLRKIAKLISTDVGISAAIIKTINSPFYGLKNKITSIEQSVNLLGMNNVAALVTSLALRNSTKAAGLERFWDEAARTALVAAYLAQQLGSISKEDAHLYGLFRDCGIPILMQRFPDYKDTLKLANAAGDRAFTEAEDEHHGTNHAVVGGLLANNWQLPAHIRDAIRMHHDLSVFDSGLSNEVLNLIAIAHMAEHIESGTSRISSDAEWGKLGAASLTHLMLGQDELAEFTRDAQEMLREADI